MLGAVLKNHVSRKTRFQHSQILPDLDLKRVYINED